MLNQPAILVIAASAVRRGGLQKLVSSICHGALITVGAALSSEHLHGSRAEILLVDIDSQTQADGLLRFLRGPSPYPATIVLIDNPDPVWARRILSAGVNAMLASDSGKDDLRLAIEAANAGLVLLHPSSARLLLHGPDAFRHLDDGDPMVEHLTAREREVLRLMSEGLGNRDIAVRLGISEHTAKFHASSILGKLGAGSRTEAVSQGIRRGLISL